MKVFPIVLVCMNTSAIQVMLASGYSTQDFLLQFDSFCALRGQPAYVYSDPGSQLTSAQRYVNAGVTNDMIRNLDWKEIVAKTAAKGTIWKTCPAESQWRDGRSEQAVGALKKTLKHLHNGGDVNFAEFQCLLHRAANCINQRPLGMQHRSGSEPGFAPVTPNSLLQGSRTRDPVEDPERYDDMPSKYVARLKMVEKQFDVWWQAWYRVMFDHMIPYKKWKTERPNLEVGDLCFLKYQGGMAPADYRRCKVTKLYPDTNGLVRTVQVMAWPRDCRNAVLPYNNKGLVAMDVSVQRLVLLLPVSEQGLDNPTDNSRAGPDTTGSGETDDNVQPEAGNAANETGEVAVHVTAAERRARATGCHAWPLINATLLGHAMFAA